MSDELKQLLQKQGETFEQFKSANDARIGELEKKGVASADTATKVESLNQELTRLGKEIEDVAKKSARQNAPGADEVSPEQEEHKKAFQKWLRKGEETGLRDIEKKAINMASDPDGGYFASEEIELGVTKLLGNSGAMARIATVKNIGAAQYKKRVRVSGAAMKWVGETEATGETATPRYGEILIVPETGSAEPQISQEALEDPEINLEAEIMEALQEAFDEGVGEATISGNGIKKPRGLLSYDTVANANYAWGKLGFITSGAAADFAAAQPSDRLIDLIHSLKRGYRNGASFLLNDLTLAKIRKFKDGQNNYIWQPGLQAGVADKLLGYTAETDDFMPDVGADKFALAFGDFKRAYLIVRRRGVTMLRDPYTAKPFVKFYTTFRIGGGVQNFEAVKLMKISNA